MTILYSDSLYPGRLKKYKGMTIGEIITNHINPKKFVTHLQAKAKKYCISDEVMVVSSYNRQD